MQHEETYMHTVLQSLHTIPGVIGGLVSDDGGGVLAHSFPPFFERSSLQSVSSGLVDTITGLQDATGGTKLLDFRFEHGRIVVKPLPNHFLLMLCGPNLNFQLLSISLNVAARNIDKLISQSPKPLPIDAVPTPSTPQAKEITDTPRPAIHRALTRSEALLERFHNEYDR
jgi:predicted regulator of Ras-like GTPase activity (Roadblock/LC7/MglB family)